jgi:hypothetical protein
MMRWNEKLKEETKQEANQGDGMGPSSDAGHDDAGSSKAEDFPPESSNTSMDSPEGTSLPS